MLLGKFNVTESQLKHNIKKIIMLVDSRNWFYPLVLFGFLLLFTYSQLAFATLTVRLAMALFKGYDETAS